MTDINYIQTEFYEHAQNLYNEKDPDGKNPHEPGAKLDAGKIPIRRGLLEYFPRACLGVAEVSMVGAQKYAWKGWESVVDGIYRYGDAEVRHIVNAEIDKQKQGVKYSTDMDTKLLHAKQEAWNAMAHLELIMREIENEV